MKDCNNVDRGNLLKLRQGYALDAKIELSKIRIQEWYEHWKGKVYVAFSGGKDLTVLLDLVRSIYPEVPAVFVDTGLEYPEIKEFVRSVDNVVWLKPKMSYRKVVEKHGYPVISKQVAMGFDRLRNTKSETQRNLRLYGGINPTSGKKQQRTIPLKWHYLVDQPFKISEKCCDMLKKNPSKKYNKKTGRKPYVGILTGNSIIRKQRYMKVGCNAFENKEPVSWPLSFWEDEDIWGYIKTRNLGYSEIYNMGETKTGCMWCMFGVHLDGNPNRFQRMKNTHPKIYNYCINKMELGKVLDTIGVDYE